ncbi:MAG: 1-deoxy-D-xylulose-5-phosphate synthase [Brevinema sp.]
MSILDHVNSPEDVKNLSSSELKILASEIRTFLIDSVSKTGGHLAPNLGVVELTIALHRVFNSPKDSMMWDVGHQSYVHKILTGRSCFFSTLRQEGGLNGFPCPEESVHDVFHAGHASTSISICAGIAGAKRQKGETSATIAIIGDGSFTSGMVYEALNDIAWRNLPVIIILNDNKMSISENVGGISRHLDRLRTHRWYLRTKRRIHRILKHIPFGFRIAEMIYSIKAVIKNIFIQKHTIFDSLGVQYFGPFDGHDIENLTALFSYVKNEKSPILLHILTKKGLGFKESEKNPIAFHGVSGKFASQSGESFSSVFGRVICEVAEKDPRIMGITAAMKEGTGLVEFANRFPQRYIDVGIAESHAVGLAAGLAQQGYRPVVAIYSTFLQRAYDQCVHDVGIGSYPVIFALDRAGLVPADGPTHQGVFDIAFLLTIPNFIIFSPIDSSEMEMALKFALIQDAPFAFRYPKDVVPQHKYHLPALELGRGTFLRRGTKGVIAFFGPLLEGFHDPQWDGWALYHLRFAKPISESMLTDLASFERIIIVEEGVAALGLLLKEKISVINPHAQIFLKYIKDEFPPIGTRKALLARYGLSPLHVEGLSDV